MLHLYFNDKHELNEWYRLQLHDILGFTDICEMLNKRILCLTQNPFFMKNIK